MFRLAAFPPVVALALGLGLIASASGLPARGRDPVRAPDPAAARTVAALAGGHPVREPRAALPADFREVMGYAPTTVRLADGTVRATKPAGACSAPGGGWPFGFDPVCRAHDLGYDVLRYAAAKGGPLGPDARRRLDALLARDLHAHCAATGRGPYGWACTGLASVYVVGAGLNSWRQGHGPPVPEPMLPWVLGLAALLLAAVPAARLATRIGSPRRLAGSLRPLERVRAMAANTPAARDRYVDFLRAASIVVVVLGHWLMIYVTRSDGRLGGGNVLAVTPGLWPLTWVLQVMPVFFFVGGFANLVTWRAVVGRTAGNLRAAYGAYLSGRAARLLRPVAVFGCVWLAAFVPLSLLEPPGVPLATVGKLLVEPLWFVGVYLIVVALAPAMATLHRRFGLGVPAALAAGVLVVDVFRLGLGLETVGYLNFLLVWTLVHQLGFYYADGGLTRLPRRSLALLGGAGLAAAAMLTGFGPYSPSMVGLPGEPSNMSPPTLAIVALALGQIAVVMLLRERVGRWLARRRPWTAVVLAGSMAMTLYLWHQTAMLVLLGALLAVGAPLPGPDSVAWWVSRPVWVALLLVVLLPLALVFARFERPGTASPQPARTAG